MRAGMAWIFKGGSYSDELTDVNGNRFTVRDRQIAVQTDSNAYRMLFFDYSSSTYPTVEAQSFDDNTRCVWSRDAGLQTAGTFMEI